jgi:hypothetical protein
MKIGYLRVSKHEQYEALQRDALKEAGCVRRIDTTLLKWNALGRDDLIVMILRPDVESLPKTLTHYS